MRAFQICSKATLKNKIIMCMFFEAISAHHLAFLDSLRSIS